MQYRFQGPVTLLFVPGAVVYLVTAVSGSLWLAAVGIVPHTDAVSSAIDGMTLALAVPLLVGAGTLALWAAGARGSFLIALGAAAVTVPVILSTPVAVALLTPPVQAVVGGAAVVSVIALAAGASTRRWTKWLLLMSGALAVIVNVCFHSVDLLAFAGESLLKSSWNVGLLNVVVAPLFGVVAALIASALAGLRHTGAPTSRA